MTRRPPLLRALITALLLSLPLWAAAAVPPTLRKTATVIETNADALVRVPGVMRLEDHGTKDKLKALVDGIVALFSFKDQNGLSELFKEDPKLLQSLSAVYADARYAPELPPIPVEFQRWLGMVQVGQAIKETETEAKPLIAKEQRTPEENQKLAGLLARHDALRSLASRISAASSGGDLQTALGSMAQYFDTAVAGGPTRSGSDGVAARTGLKDASALNLTRPVPGKPATATLPPLPKAPEKVYEAGAGNDFLPSLRVAVDALKTSFPAPISVAALAQKASVQTVRSEVQRAGAALTAYQGMCQSKSKELSIADCRQIDALLAEKKQLTDRLHLVDAAKDGAGYYTATLALNQWKDRTDLFLHGYMERWGAGAYASHSDFEQLIAGFDTKRKVAFCASLATPVAGIAAGAPVVDWVRAHYPGISRTDVALKSVRIQGEAALYCAGKVLHPVGVVLSPITNTASSAFYHAAGAGSVTLGKGMKTMATVYRGYSGLAKYFGMDKTAQWLDSGAQSWDQDGRENVSYGVATMMQSHWTVLPRTWYMEGAGGGTIEDPLGRKASGEVLEDLKMHAVTHLSQQWGAALPAAAYFGMVNRDPNKAEVAEAVKNGAGGVKGAMKSMLDDAASSWDEGGWQGKLKAGGLWTMVTTIKAGDMAAQSLGFAWAGGAIGAMATDAGAASNIAKAANIYKVTTEVGKYPFYLGLVEGGGQTLRAAAAGDTRGVMEGTSELAAAGSPLALGHFAKAPAAAKPTKTAPEVVELKPAASPELVKDIFEAMGAKPAPREAVMSAESPVTAVSSLGRQEYRINGKAVQRLGAGDMKDVLVHPENPDLVIKIYQSGAEAGSSARNMRYELARNKMLEAADASPKVLENGVAPLNGKVNAGYVVQERVRGSDLEIMSPIKYRAVAEMFDRLVAHRIKITDQIKIEKNIMVEPDSGPTGFKAKIVDAEIVDRVPERSLMDKLLQRPDPLRAHYDKILAGMKSSIRRSEVPMKMSAESGSKSDRLATEEDLDFTRGHQKQMIIDTLTPNERAAYRSFKDGVIDHLVREGFSEGAAAKELEASFDSMPQFVRWSIQDPAGQSGAFVDSIRLKLVDSQLRADLAKEGVDARRLESFMRRSWSEMRGKTLQEAKDYVHEQFAAVDQGVAQAKKLRGNTVEERKGADYDELLDFAVKWEQANPALADYIKPWKNLALSKTYHESLAGKNSLRNRAIDYIDAKGSGRVFTYYRTANVEQQKGPSCAIHALYNIVATHFYGKGKIPPYQAFERAVQTLVGKNYRGEIAGKDTGLSTDSSIKVARAAGMEATAVERLPATSAEFEALLASRQGAALVSITYREARAFGKVEAGNHAVYIGEKWVDAEGRTWFSVADSNGKASDVAFYTWEQLKPRLRSVTLLRPAGNQAEFQQAVYKFTGSDPVRLQAIDEYKELRKRSNGPSFYQALLDNPALAKVALELDPNFKGLFSSLAQFQTYAAGQARKGGGGGLMNFESPVKAEEPRALGKGEVIIDANAAIALSLEPGQRHAGHRAMVTRLTRMGKGLRMTETGLSEWKTRSDAAGVSIQPVKLEVPRESAQYKSLLAELAGSDPVGTAKGANDQSIVADAFFSAHEPGTVPTLVTADGGLYKALARRAGIEPDKLGMKVPVAYPEGFNVTVQGRTLHVLPVGIEKGGK